MDGSSDKGAPRSKHFDDVYFSAQDGFAETRHVFLSGNNLPERWAGQKDFVIAETGFGTGLNFLAVCRLYEDAQNKPERLHFISFEKFPLSKQEIEKYLAPWKNEFPDLLKRMLEQYPNDLSGIQSIEFSANITLTLIFGDVNEAIEGLKNQVDCWFLDGFTPALNPDMWTDTLFQNMARVSKEDATFATFTAAGFVKRGLANVGFDVQKIKGFGRKREMLIGSYNLKEGAP